MVWAAGALAGCEVGFYIDKQEGKLRLQLGGSGVDVVFAASTDLGSFSGFRQGQPDYEEMVKTIHDATVGAKRRLGGPLAWRDRKDFTFFQAQTESNFIRLGVEAALKAAPQGQAPIEGAER